MNTFMAELSKIPSLNLYECRDMAVEAKGAGGDGVIMVSGIAGGQAKEKKKKKKGITNCVN